MTGTLLTVTLVLVMGAAVVALAWRLSFRSGVPVDRAVATLDQVNVAALCTLMSKREYRYLRSALPAHDFRKIHRARMRVALTYLGDLDRCLAVLGAALAHSELAEKAQPISEQLPSVRLTILRLQAGALVSMIFPGAHSSAEALYEFKTQVSAAISPALPRRQISITSDVRLT